VSVDLEYDEPSGSFEVRVVNRSEHPIYVKAVAVDDARNSPPEWEWVGGQGPIEPHDWRYFGREWHFVGSITVRAWVRLGNDKVVSTEARTFE
jgi:hypothetical protein